MASTDSPPQTNHYLQHLTDVNETQAVTASEDIFNQFGVLLIAKGSRINSRAQSQLQQHRLEKTLDQQVALETTLSDQQIFQQTLLMLESSVELAQLQQHNKFDDPFRHICLSGNLPLQIRQKLTVMSQQLPDLFQHSLFNGWASAMIAKEMKLKPAACREAYICGLVHDIGLLHLPTEVQTQTPLSAENWRALKSHVVIGQRFAEECGLPPAIGRGILEHHERFDQTGYPARKAPEKLGLLGQIVASADLIHSLCTNELSHSEGSIYEALPYFKIHHGSFNERIHTALMRILSLAALDRAESDTPQKPVNLERVRQINSQLQRLTAPLEKFTVLLAQLKHPEGPSVITTMRSISNLLGNSGIGDSNLNDWLMSDLDPGEHDNAASLREIDTMQYEMLWLVKRLGWNMKDFLESPASNEGHSLISQIDVFYNKLHDAVVESFKLYSNTPEPTADTIAVPLQSETTDA
ncbi:MAG: HD domain-containing phosphohydrolase [Motiliproteus sp.]